MGAFGYMGLVRKSGEGGIEGEGGGGGGGGG